jgi:hypothetical protein
MIESAMTRTFKERLGFASAEDVDEITCAFMSRFSPLVWKKGLSSEDVPFGLREKMRIALFDEIRPLIRGDPKQDLTYPDDEAINSLVMALLEDIDYELIPGLWESKPRWDHPGVLSDPRARVAVIDQKASLVFVRSRWKPLDEETRHVFAADLDKWGLTYDDLLDAIEQGGGALDISGYYPPTQYIEKALEGREEQIDLLFASNGRLAEQL